MCIRDSGDARQHRAHKRRAATLHLRVRHGVVEELRREALHSNGRRAAARDSTINGDNGDLGDGAEPRQD
eukprot:6469334-Alexandrium_andersonii.AAC.1